MICPVVVPLIDFWIGPRRVDKSEKVEDDGNSMTNPTILLSRGGAIGTRTSNLGNMHTIIVFVLNCTIPIGGFVFQMVWAGIFWSMVVITAIVFSREEKTSRLSSQPLATLVMPCAMSWT